MPAPRYDAFVADRTRQSSVTWLALGLVVGLLTIARAVNEGNPGGAVIGCMWTVSTLPVLLTILFSYPTYVAWRQNFWVMTSLCR